MALPAEKRQYTFADVLIWDENERAEIIGGEAVMLATPASIHQEISGELFYQLYNYLKGKKVKFTPPRLPSACLRRTGTARRMWTRWSSRTFR